VNTDTTAARACVWVRRVQSVGIALAVWFGAGFVAGLVFMSLGVVVRSYAHVDLLGPTILGAAALVVFGPVSYVLRRRPLAAIVLAAILGWLLMTVFSSLAGAPMGWTGAIAPRIYREAFPALVGGGTAWLCLKCYRWQGWQ
jgi:hypothetical protein